MLPPKRALLSVSDKSGLIEFASGLIALGYELVSTGGTAAALRDGRDRRDRRGRCNWRRRDARRPGQDAPSDASTAASWPTAARPTHRRAAGGAAIAPFDLVVVNLYPFAQAAERPGIALAELVEEIDIGGPAMVRATAKNFASVAIVTSPAHYENVLAALRDAGGVPLAVRAALAVEAFRHVAAYDARIVAELPRRMAAELACPTSRASRRERPVPDDVAVGLREGRDAALRREPAPSRGAVPPSGQPAGRGPFAAGMRPSRASRSATTTCSIRPPWRLSRATCAGPHARSSNTPIRAALPQRPRLLLAWEAALAGDPVSAFGGVVALTGTVDAMLAERLAAIFLEVVIAPGFSDEARAVGHERSWPAAPTPGHRRPAWAARSRLAEFRSAGGGLLVGTGRRRARRPGELEGGHLARATAAG